jgi:hypothetical protein
MDPTYPLLVSLLTHTQRLFQAHAKLLEQSGVRLAEAERAEHERILRDVKAVIEGQSRWLARADHDEDAASEGRA